MGENWDVAVAGAGPAGSASACLLARQGYRVVLLDRAHFPRPKACAEYMSPGVIETVQRLGLGGHLEPRDACRVPGMDIISPRGSCFRLEYHLDQRRLWASTLPRHQFDAALLRAAQDAGVHTYEGWHARSPIVEDGAVRGFRGMAGGETVEVRARLCIIADGCRSALARALGLAVPPRWPVRLGLVAYFGGTPRLQGGFGQMHVRADGYCGIAPLPDGQVNVAIVVPADAVRRAGIGAVQFFDRWIEQSPTLRDALAGCERISPVRGVGPIGSRTRRAWCPGALLVGDAAAFFDPFTGEGIYRALRGAEIAAHVATRALCGLSTSEYDRLRSAAFRRKEFVTSLVQLFVQYPQLMEYSLPRLARRTKPARTLSLVLGDVQDAGAFLRPGMLWSALRP